MPPAFLALVFGLLGGAPVLSWSSVPSSHCLSKNGRSTLLAPLLSTPSELTTSALGEKQQRKPKRNKYAQFSKVQQLDKDPFDELLAETQQKIQALEDEKEHQKQQKRQLLLTNIPPAPALTFPSGAMSPSSASIDPYDPSTFGYTEIGRVVGAHGVHGWLKIQSNTDYGPQRLGTAGIRHLKPARKRAPRPVVLLQGKPHTTRRSRQSDNTYYLIQLDQVTDRDAAQNLRGSTLYIRSEEQAADDRPDTMSGDSDSLVAMKEEVMVDESLPANKGKVSTKNDTSEEPEEYWVSELVGLEVRMAAKKEENHGNPCSQASNTTFVGWVHSLVLAEDMCATPGLGHDTLEVILQKGPVPSFRDELVLIPLVPQLVPKVNVKEGYLVIDPPAGLLDLTYVRSERVRVKGFLPSNPNNKDEKD